MKKLLSVFSAIVLAAGFFFLGSCVKSRSAAGTQSSSQAHTVSIGGSTSVTPLMEMFIEEYSKTHADVRFTISGTGSGDGIKGAGEGTYELGMSSRDLTPTEIGTGLDPLIVAIDGIALILNSANPIISLSLAEVRDIYTGTITLWEQLGPAANGKTGGIAVISREPGSGTRGAFGEILKFQDDQMVRNAVIFDGTGAVKAAVTSNVDAIGYISMGSLDSNVKALSVDGVGPSAANVLAGSYKIARPFIVVTKKGAPLNTQTKAFLDWVMGAGQDIVKKSWISVN